LGMILGDSRFKHFADSDIFVLPSYSEGLPLSILEAMAFGLPIIATDVGAISEVVKSKNGILIRPKDAEGLKKAIQKILDSPKRDEYMKNNIQVIKENYTKQIMKRDLTRIYESFN